MGFVYANSTHRTTAQPKKRGAKNYFQGSRLAFLERYCDEYIALCGKSRHQFWHKLFEEWWQRYPWCLPDHEEPPANNPEKMKELASAGLEDMDEKSEVEERLHNMSLFR